MWHVGRRCQPEMCRITPIWPQKSRERTDSLPCCFCFLTSFFCKPANVLLDAAQHVFVTDFGFAQLIAKTPGQAAGVGGTAGYMAPEQLNPDVGEIGPATDIYGLGALFYSLLTRQPPGGLPIALASREIVPTIVRPRDLREDVPAEVEDICLRCLQWRPTDRYQRAADIIAALQPWVARPRA